MVQDSIQACTDKNEAAAIGLSVPDTATASPLPDWDRNPARSIKEAPEHLLGRRGFNVG